MCNYGHQCCLRLRLDTEPHTASVGKNQKDQKDQKNQKNQKDQKEQRIEYVEKCCLAFFVLWFYIIVNYTH